MTRSVPLRRARRGHRAPTLPAASAEAAGSSVPGTRGGAARKRPGERRWLVPPMLLSAGEPFEAHHVLDELRNGLGLVLWQLARDARLWATAAPRARGELFAQGAAERMHHLAQAAAEPGSPLLRSLTALGRLYDGSATPGDVHAACREVSQWAGSRGLRRTALVFAQSAAVVSPESPESAYEAGDLACRGGDPGRADPWLRRTLALARRARDWKYYGLALIGLGTSAMERGNPRLASQHFMQALRVARRHGLWVIRSLALHQQFAIAARRGDVLEAERFARRTLRAYGQQHPRIVRLAHDLARVWLDAGQYARALRVMVALRPHLTSVPDQRLLLGGLGHAAAGLDDRAKFAEYWSDAWFLVDRGEDDTFVAESLLQLATGAAALGDVDRSVMAAEEALRVASRRGEHPQAARAHELLDRIRRARLPAFSPPPPEPAESQGEALASLFINALTQLGQPFDAPPPSRAPGAGEAPLSERSVPPKPPGYP